MEIKFGKIKPNTNFFTELSSETEDVPEVNIFASSKFEFNQGNPSPSFGGQRLNDFDSNILGNNAYQEMPDEMFKLEHRIGLLEDSVAKIDSEIVVLESFNYSIQVFELKNRKAKILQELQLLNEQYAKLGLSTKISGQLASAVNFASKKKKNSFERFKKFFSKKILAKLSKKIDYAQKMKEALESLSDINTSVDELIQMSAPYGETLNRYEKLTAYLNKANVIHSKISLNVSDLTKKKA